MGNITRLLKIGFGSFIDKNTYPFVVKYTKGFLILNYVLFFFCCGVQCFLIMIREIILTNS